MLLFHCTKLKERGKNYSNRGISVLSMVVKIYAGIPIDRIRRVSDDEQGGFRERRGCVYQIFILKKIGEKA